MKTDLRKQFEKETGSFVEYSDDYANLYFTIEYVEWLEQKLSRPTTSSNKTAKEIAEYWADYLDSPHDDKLHHIAILNMQKDIEEYASQKQPETEKPFKDCEHSSTICYLPKAFAYNSDCVEPEKCIHHKEKEGTK